MRYQNINVRTSRDTLELWLTLNLPTSICKEGSVHNGDFQLESISQVSNGISTTSSFNDRSSEPIFQTFATVFLGAGISNAVCLLVWRGSATSKLQ